MRQQLLASLAILIALQLFVFCNGAALGDSKYNGILEDLGSIENKTYYYHTQPMNWANAKTFCENGGNQLATITSQAQQDFLKSKNVTAGFAPQQYWTAGRDARTINQFAWTYTNEAMTDYGQNWFFSAQMTCVIYYSHGGTSNGNWYSYPCTNQFRFLCESV